MVLIARSCPIGSGTTVLLISCGLESQAVRDFHCVLGLASFGPIVVGLRVVAASVGPHLCPIATMANDGEFTALR